MSFILYNPLEAMVLILPFWFINKHKINFSNKRLIIKNFLKDTYILSTIFLLSQIPLNFLYESIFYGYYNIICITFVIIILYFYNVFRFKSKKLLMCIIVEILYNSSLMLIITYGNLFFMYKIFEQSFSQELYANLCIKFLQFIILFLILGGYTMLKKKMVKESKKNLGKMVASTQLGFGEKKLSEKLKTEVRKSK